MGGATALHICACKGRDDHLQLLLQQPGIELHHTDADDLTAFQQALWKNQTRIVEIFLSSPHAPSLLRHRDADPNGRVLTYFELARKRSNSRLKEVLQNAVHKEVYQLLTQCFPK